MADEYLTHPASSRWHDGLPIGERLSARPLLDQPLIGFEDARMKPLEPMLVPERPRGGELDPSECFHCDRGRDHWIWADDLWHVGSSGPSGIPFIAGLAPNEHVRLHEMTGDLLASLGPVVQRLAVAIQGLDGVARTHFSRWGDGSAHFHMTFLARPLGMMQGRGYMLAVWDDVLPPADPELLADNRRQVARALAAGGGEALV
jgi:hypothetical protein